MSTEIDIDENEPRRRASGAWREVAEVLERDIIFGRLQPKEHLIEDEIMERTETSRHAVRRAFEEMEKNGLVIRQPNKGVRVRSYTRQEIENLYVVRETLEMKAASLIKLPVSDDLVAELTAIEKKHERASNKGDVVRLFELNNEFHETLYKACGNSVLQEAIKNFALMTHTIRMRHMSEKSWRDEAVRQHWKMIELLGGKKKKELIELCSEHLQPNKRFYLSVNSVPNK
jgi:DNA-binding GntR family transcriptional regulator